MFGCGIRPSGHSSICREAVTGHRMAIAIKQRERSALMVEVFRQDLAGAAGRTQTPVAVPAIAMRVAAAEAEDPSASAAVFRLVQEHPHQLRVQEPRRAPRLVAIATQR